MSTDVPQICGETPVTESAPILFETLERRIRILNGIEGNSKNDPFVAIDPIWQQVRDALHALMDVDDLPPILLQGETGTGKGKLAEYLHGAHPGLKKGAFGYLNCSAIPEGLFESELYGHERGAFTGAVSSRAGLFETSRGGMLFLDEVGDLPPHQQGKILHVLDHQNIRRVGGTGTIKVNDVAVVLGTNKNLRTMVNNGEFREDLLQRIAIVTLTMPPLRNRPEDIPGLLAFFIAKYRVNGHENPKSIAPDALQFLKSYDWPGNVRQLEGLARRFCIFSRSKPCIDRQDVMQSLGLKEDGEKTDPESPLSLREHIELTTRRYITAALREREGNVTKAAEDLGLHRIHLYRIIKREGFNLADFRPGGKVPH